MSTRSASSELQMDPTSLYREEIFTDRRIGTLRRLTPVTPTGDADGTRQTVYMGEAQVLTPVGAIPISFEIDAKTLGEAVERFGELAQEAFERTVRELQELRREAASSIVIPDRLPGGSGGLGGGMGGGKIQLP